MFNVALAAVINGLGIVRIVGGLGDFIRGRDSSTVKTYRVNPLANLLVNLISC